MPRAERVLPLSELNSSEEPDAAELGQRERRRAKRFGQDVPVHIDGVFRGMLKFSELPPDLPTHFQLLDGDPGEEPLSARRFAWTEYLASLGVELAELNAIHFYGGRNIVCMVEGSEIRRVGDAFRFSFTRGDAGHPRLKLPEEGIRYNSFIDKIRAVAIYIRKRPPRYEQGMLHFADGKSEPVSDERGTLNIPYSDGERHGGTRVYLDGHYVASFRRRALDSALLIHPSDRNRYSLSMALASFGVPLATVRRAQIFGPHDMLLGELSAGDLEAGGRLAFVVPQHSRGKIAVPSLSSSDDDRVHSIVLFSKKKPADRSMPQHGDLTIQGSQEKSSKNKRHVAARTVH